MIFIPNRTFLVRFGGISGEFGRAMVRILASRSRAKIPMVRPDYQLFRLLFGGKTTSHDIKDGMMWEGGMLLSIRRTNILQQLFRLVLKLPKNITLRHTREL